MRKKLSLSLALCAGIFTAAFADNTYCVTDDFGEQASLTISGETVTGSIDYTPFGSTVWPCSGTYDRSTGTLHFVATNPNPDNCTSFATTVTFDYTRTDVKTGFGSFSNDCGNAGSLGASATQGACAYAGFALKKGEFGSTATRKMNRTRITLPRGVDFKNLAPAVAAKTPSGTTYCVTDDFGEQASLTVSGETVTGSIDYSAFGSTIWPCEGTYDRSTGTLHFVATNPNPDNCTSFASTVTFDYTRTDVKTGFGSFSNDCGNAGSLGASATQGACPYAGVVLKKGEYGSTATRKMNRTKITLPPGVDFRTLAPAVAAKTPSGTTYCVTDDFGEQASLTVSGETVTGSIDYSAFGSTIWPCEGTYDRSTGTLHFVATNPNPDNCTSFASTVTFDYTRTDVKTGFGSFSNDCGNAGSLGASATQGACPYAGVVLKKGEYGSTATRKMNRTRITLPPGVDFRTLAPGIAVSVSPNPSVKNATITVKLDAATKINISVYDQSGNLVKTIADGSLKQGTTNYSWNLQSQSGAKVKTGYYTIKVNGSYDQKSVKVFVGE